jgi:pectin methylesterase-like acyl-CoA thioesterase
VAATTGLVNARTVPVTASPLLAVATGTTLPANNATGVPADTLLRLGFDATPTLGTTGTIQIFEAAGTLVDTINLADPYAIYDGSQKLLTMNTTSSKVNVIGGLLTGIDQVRVVNYVPIAINGNTVTIFPHNNRLTYNTAYYVTIDSGVFAGTISTATFNGISSATAWTFTTKAAAPSTLNVAADNSGDFATVQGAIDAIALKNSADVTIDIAPGVYQEMLFVRAKKNITFLGTSGNDGVDTIIQYDNSDGFNPTTGGGQAVTTPGAGGTIPANLTAGGRAVMLTSSTTGIVLDGITLMNLHGQGSLVLPTLPTSTTVVANTDSATPTATYVNYSSSVTQAETLYFNTSFTSTTSPGTLIAEHSNFVSYQDTLQLKGFSWFYDSFVTGDTDFIWGNTNGALFERCEIKSRYNTNGSSVVQSRAYLGFGTTAAPANFDTSYPGFVFLNSALTKEAGTFTAYLARSAGPPLPTPATTTGDGGVIDYYYAQYDIVSYIGCSMDTHIAPVGWSVSTSAPGSDVSPPNPVAGWREYGSTTPAGAPLDVSQRLVDPTPDGVAPFIGGSLQLSAADVATFFPNRATILAGATDGTTYTLTGLPGFNPTP